VSDLPPPNDDGLVTPKVGPWSLKKHHYLKRYIEIFTKSMTPQGWGSLHYIDLFAGAGIEQIKGGSLEWGSPLIAAQAPKQFKQLHLCDNDKEKYEVLCKRLEQFPQRTEPQLILGDANNVVSKIVQAVPANSLSLAFLDPFGLDVHFQTLRELSQRRVDLIIFFPGHLDALRNWESDSGRVNRVLGTDEWLKEFEKSPVDKRAEILNKNYMKQIRSLGYSHFADERISLPNGRFLYKLIFCSKHPRGVDLWTKSAHKGADGQRHFEYD